MKAGGDPFSGLGAGLIVAHSGDFRSPAALPVRGSEGCCVQGVGGPGAGLGDDLWPCSLCPDVQGSGFDPESAMGVEGTPWGALGFIWWEWGA